MYPKNAASPERIAVGPVVLIADGTVQTADVLVKVVPQGGAAGGSAGTISYVEGIVHYVPSQAETNYTSFTVVAYKASCIPAAVTVVTTAAAVSGTVVLAGQTHTNAVIPTVTTVTDAVLLPSIPANWITAAGINATALDGKGDWNVGKIGYSLTQSFPANFEDMSISATTGLVALASTQKVDVETIETRAITCAAPVTVLASVGTASASTAQTGDAYARLGAPAGVSVSADVAAVKGETATIVTDTNEIQTKLPAGGALMHAAGAAVAKSPATLATADVTGNLPANIKAINSVTIAGDGSATPFDVA